MNGGNRTRLSAALFILALALAPSASASASADASASPRVVEVIGATAEVHDVARLGERTLLATSGGLVVTREGAATRTLTSRQGLPGTRLRSVSVVSGRVWVGGVEGVAELGVGDDGELRFARKLPLRRVRRVVRFAGATFFASYGGGLHRLEDGEGARPESLRLGRSHARRRLTDLVIVGDELWASSASAGILRVGEDGRLTGRIHRGRGLVDDIVFDLHVDGATVYAATMGGVSVIEGGRVRAGHRVSRQVQRLPVRDVRAVRVAHGSVWVATFGDGVHRLRGGSVRRVGRAADRDLATRPLALGESEGGLVVGHLTGAHEVGADGQRLRRLTGGGLPSADVTALARAFGSIWIGTFDAGLARLQDGHVVPASAATARWGVDRRVNDLAVTRGAGGEERLWIATDRGLYYHDGRVFSPVEEPAAPGRVHVTSLHVDGSGSLWVTSSRMLSVLREGRWEAWGGDDRFPVMQLHSVTTDAEGGVWVGSLHGLFRLDPETGEFSRHTVSSGELPVDWVTALVPWEGGVVAGTYHGGLSWYDGERFRIEAEGEGGVPAGWVNPHAMQVVEGSLWIGTMERGLVVGRSSNWSRLRVEDGLPSDDVTDILAGAGGEVWIATRGGLALVRP